MTELRENSVKNIDSYKLLVDEYEDKNTFFSSFAEINYRILHLF